MNDQTGTAKANGQTDAAKADRELKQKHRAMWASGDYPALADEMLLELGAILVEACGITSRHNVLDVAAHRLGLACRLSHARATPQPILSSPT